MASCEERIGPIRHSLFAIRGLPPALARIHGGVGPGEQAGNVAISQELGNPGSGVDRDPTGTPADSGIRNRPFQRLRLVACILRAQDVRKRAVNAR